MKQIAILILVLVFFGCKKEDPPQPPAMAQLVFPEQNSECTTGESVNEGLSLVEFRWNASARTDSYVVRYTNMGTNDSKSVKVEDVMVSIRLEKGALYSWSVTSENSRITDKATSETWLFYNAGAQETYAPFPAQVQFPSSGETVSKDMNNEIDLNWTGADVDDDIASYEVYFSNVTPPLTLVSTQSGSMNYKVSVTSGGTYYWKIVTKDMEGNTSDSGIFEFKVN